MTTRRGFNKYTNIFLLREIPTQIIDKLTCNILKDLLYLQYIKSGGNTITSATYD